MRKFSQDIINKLNQNPRRYGKLSYYWVYSGIGDKLACILTTCGTNVNIHNTSKGKRLVQTDIHMDIETAIELHRVLDIMLDDIDEINWNDDPLPVQIVANEDIIGEATLVDGNIVGFTPNDRPQEGK